MLWPPSQPSLSEVEYEQKKRYYYYFIFLPFETGLNLKLLEEKRKQKRIDVKLSHFLRLLRLSAWFPDGRKWGCYVATLI